MNKLQKSLMKRLLLWVMSSDKDYFYTSKSFHLNLHRSALVPIYFAISPFDPAPIIKARKLEDPQNCKQAGVDVSD